MFTGFVCFAITAGTIAFAITGNKTTGAETSHATAGHSHEMHAYTPTSYDVTLACDAFTLDEARTLLGSDTAQNAASSPSTRDDITTDTCSYAAGTTVTVTIHSALNESAAKDAQHDFNHNHTADQMVDGFGKHAFFAAERKDLNIYDNNRWIVIGLGDAPSDQAGLRLTKSIAEAIL